MIDSFKDLEINISTAKENIYLNDKFNIKVDIKNNSNTYAENILFMLVINPEMFSFAQENFNTCFNKFGGIGSIAPGKNITLEIPVQSRKTCTDFSSNIYATINYHRVENGTLKDFNCRSNDLIIDLLESNLLTKNDFTISSSKNIYFIDEYIDLTIKIKNNDLYGLSNLKLSNYIPKNTKLIQDSIASNELDKLIITDNEIIILDIDKSQEIEINYKIVVLNADNHFNFIVSPVLAYNDKTKNDIKITAKSNEIMINNRSVFLEDDFVYKIDKYEVLEDDIVTHTLTLKNNTNTLISNLQLKYNENKKLHYILNSLIVDDIYRVGEDINNLIELGELEPNETMCIQFKTKVTKSEYHVLSRFLLEYDTKRKRLSQKSNTQEYKILRPVFDVSSFTKSVDKKSYYLGEICETTIDIINLGNLTAENVILRDILPKNLEFIHGSLLLDGINVGLDLFYDGIKIGDIIPNKKIVIKYKARSVDVCNSKLTNANITYSIKNNPTELKSHSSESQLNIFGAKIGNNNIKKELSAYSAQIGDIITCKILVENTGNIDCESIKIYDTLNNALEFIDNSVFINKVQESEEDIFNGINIDRIKPNETITISYQIKVLDFPKPNPIIDKSTLTYSYLLNDKLKSNTIYSNKSKIYINNPELSIIDKNSKIENGLYTKFCNYQDNIYFHFELENKGNVGIEDINMTLNLPQNLNIALQSLRINSQPYNKHFKNTVKLPNLNVAQKIYVDFFVDHTALDNFNLEAAFYFEYSFRDLKSKEYFRKNTKFKEDIIIINPDIEINKFISDQDIEIDREFTKNINLINSGNVDLKDITIFLNESNFLKQSENTIFLNGHYIQKTDDIKIDSLGIGETINIAIRYNIDNVPLCESIIPESEVVAKYNLFDDSFMSIKRKSNTIKLDIKEYNIEITGKSSSDLLMLNEIYQYTFCILNKGNVNCSSLKLDINLPECFEYVNNSIFVNSNNITLSKLNKPIIIDPLNCNESVNVTFSFITRSVPFKGISNISSILYANYTLLEKNIKKTFKSNETILNVENLSLDIVKSASHNYLQTGEILQIQTILNNIGTIDIKNLFIKDNKNENLLFVENSVYIDGENIEDLDPITGIKLDKLNSSDNILITYEYEYIPRICSNKVIHFSTINYSYTKHDKLCKDVVVESDKIYIEGALSTFKQFSIENEYTLKDYEPDIREIISTFTDVKVEDFYEIDSIKNKSFDNSTATGKKVIVKGFVMNRVEYLIENAQSSLYMLERTQPFTVFISLPSEYESENLYFKAKCDDMFYKTTTSRGVFMSSLISIEGLL